jgi:hypothetical protein
MKSAKKPSGAIIWIEKARSPLRIFASIHTSRDRGTLSGMNKCHPAIGGSANNRDMKQ